MPLPRAVLTKSAVATSILALAVAAAPRLGKAVALAVVILSVVAADGRAKDPYAPTGPQRTLVIFAKYPDTLCPITDGTCPSALGTIEPPRHPASEWQALLSTWLDKYWRQASYDQASFAIDVLVDGASRDGDGWWIAPHSRQEYLNNGLGAAHDNFNPVTAAAGKPGISYATYGFVTDVAEAAIERAIANGWTTAAKIKTYTRLVVIDNVHDRGGQTAGGLVTVSTKATGAVALSATVAAESFEDFDAITVLLHELGHQLGARAHYGDCTGPYLSPLLSSDVECLGNWDVMAWDYRAPLPTAYTRIDRGWLPPTATKRVDLGASDLDETVVLAPLERNPSGLPNALRISAGPNPGTSPFTGYYAECRQRLGGDEGLPGLAAAFGKPADTLGIVEAGVLVTSVHEEALAVKGLPVHVVRPGFGSIDEAALSPGEELNTFPIRVAVRFDGYEALPTGERGCRVTVRYRARPWTLVEVVPKVPLPGGAKDTVGLSPDVAAEPLTHPWPKIAPPGPIAIPRPWWGHRNELSVRVHNRGTRPVGGLRVDVSVGNRVTVAGCGSRTGRSLATLTLPAIAAGADATGSLPWRPGRDPSAQVSVRVRPPRRAIAPGAQTVTNAFAFRYYRRGRHGLPALRTRLWLSARGCNKTQSFSVAPAVGPRGWRVSVSQAHATVLPGQRMAVNVVVRPPRGARPGAGEQIPVNVLQLDSQHNDQQQRPRAADRSEHYEVVGGATILARVVAAPAHVRLTCSSRASRISGRVVGTRARGRVVIEYRGPSGRTRDRELRLRRAGRFAARLAHPPGRGWRAQAWWSGDRRHAPAESRSCGLG